MKKKSALQIMKAFRLYYLILAGIGVAFAIAAALIPSSGQLLAPAGTAYPRVYAVVSPLVSALVYFWYSWLVQRFVDGKSDGTVYMVLMIVVIVGGFVSFFMGTGDSVAIADTIVSGVSLFFLLKARKERAAGAQE